MKLPNFEVEPVHLSPEHARHDERFTGYPYDADKRARMQGYVAFKRWHHAQYVARAERRS